MSQYIRAKTTGAYYFFTVVTHQRQKILCKPEVRAALRNAINEVRQTMPFDIIAWVLLPDHMHCIWALPTGDYDYSNRLARIKRKVSKQCRTKVKNNHLSPSLKKGKEIGFWQRRFWEHQIRDEIDLKNHINYVHFNPVKHGFCDVASQWQWSSLLRYIKQGKHSKDWGKGIDIPKSIGHE